MCRARKFFPPCLLLILCTGAFAFVQLGGEEPSTNSAHYSQNQTSEAERQTPAYQNGYQDGWNEGEADWARSASFHVNRSQAYHDADRGYDLSLGKKDEYRRIYRRGFEEGYRTGYGPARGLPR